MNELPSTKTLAVNVPALADEPAETRMDTTLAGTGAPAASVPLRQFGRYQLLQELGRGGMGQVYLAHDDQLHRQVALKLPRFSGGCDERHATRFLREARIAASFAHPNLCPVYDYGVCDGTHYLTMPFLEGETLGQILKREGRMPPERSVRWAVQIAHALQAAHALGIVHRDLKPANVMIAPDERPIVMDFGLAWRDAPDEERLTAHGDFIGTPAYSAPEQIGGNADDLGPPADIYALGVVLYEMLTGQVPFRGKPHEILRQVLTQEPEPPSVHRPDLDPALVALCLRSLRKEPADRFASMAAFADALEGWLSGSLTEIEPRAKPIRKQRLLRWLILSAASSVVALFFIWKSTRPQATVAFAPFTMPPVETVIDPLPVGTQWRGHFRFVEPEGLRQYTGDVVLIIEAREGDTFRGSYATEMGKYSWRAEGRIEQQSIRWGFTSTIREEEPRQIVGIATVDGTIVGEEMKLKFRNPAYNAVAEMKLNRMR